MVWLVPYTAIMLALIAAERGQCTHEEALTVAQQVELEDVQDHFLPFMAEGILSEKLQNSKWLDTLEQMPGLTEAVTMYFCLADPRTPLRIKLIIAGALVYLMSPIDIIPDNIVVLGQLDDMSVLAAALFQVVASITEVHVEQAEEWLEQFGIEPSPFLGIYFIPQVQAYEAEKRFPGSGAAVLEQGTGSHPMLPGR